MKTKTRKEKVALALLFNPTSGVSEREMVFNLNLTSGRNEIAEIERNHNIKFNREWNKTADGQGQYYRYYCPNKTTALRLIDVINQLRRKRGKPSIQSDDIQEILMRYEV